MTYLLPNLGTVQGGMYIDPTNWIINGFGGVFFDENLSASNISNVQEELWQAYPNPAQDYIYVKQKDQTPLTFMLFESNGKLLQKGPLEIGQGIDVHQLKSGSYILRLQDAKNIRTQLVTIK
jgi:hypothetical protein